MLWVFPIISQYSTARDGQNLIISTLFHCESDHVTNFTHYTLSQILHPESI